MRIVRGELKKMKWLRKYPFMASVVVSGIAAGLIAFGQQDMADFLLKISQGYGETGFPLGKVIAGLVALIQAVSTLVKLYRDRQKGRALAAKGGVDLRS